MANGFFTLFNEYHGLNNHEADAASAVVWAMACGLQNTGMATMAADSPALAAGFASPARLAMILTAVGGVCASAEQFGHHGPAALLHRRV